MPKDNIYLTTIKNIVSQHIKAKASMPVSPTPSSTSSTPSLDRSRCNWDEAESDSKATFAIVHKLLMSVSRCEFAVMCAGWIVEELPIGAEKLGVLKFCIKLAQKWVAACGDQVHFLVRIHDELSIRACPGYPLLDPFRESVVEVDSTFRVLQQGLEGTNTVRHIGVAEDSFVQ